MVSCGAERANGQLAYPRNGVEDITPNITIVRGALGKRPLTAVDITGVGKMTLNVTNILALPVNLEAEGKVGP